MTILNLKKSIIISVILFLFGCAGSPVHTSSLSIYELQSVDNYTLCKAATPRELYEPNGKVINEVMRRGIDCRSVYTYTATPIFIPKTQPNNPQPQQGTHTYVINGRYVTCTTTGTITNCN